MLEEGGLESLIWREISNQMSTKPLCHHQIISALTLLQSLIEYVYNHRSALAL